MISPRTYAALIMLVEVLYRFSPSLGGGGTKMVLHFVEHAEAAQLPSIGFGPLG